MKIPTKTVKLYDWDALYEMLADGSIIELEDMTTHNTRAFEHVTTRQQRLEAYKPRPVERRLSNRARWPSSVGEAALHKEGETMIKTETYVLPAYWASALINGDDSGLEDDEIKELNDFCKGLGPCVDVSEENEFSWTNDANDLGGPVATFTFQILEEHHA